MTALTSEQQLAAQGVVVAKPASPPSTGTPIPFAETTARAGCHVSVDMTGVDPLPKGEPFTGHPWCPWVEIPAGGSIAVGCDCAAGHWGKHRFTRRLP